MSQSPKLLSPWIHVSLSSCISRFPFRAPQLHHATSKIWWLSDPWFNQVFLQLSPKILISFFTRFTTTFHSLPPSCHAIICHIWIHAFSPRPVWFSSVFPSPSSSFATFLPSFPHLLRGKVIQTEIHWGQVNEGNPRPATTSQPHLSHGECEFVKYSDAVWLDKK